MASPLVVPGIGTGRERHPKRGKAVMVGLAIGFTLVTLALLYSNLAGDYRGAQLLSWLQILGNAVLAAAMWWLSSKFGGMTPLPKGTPKTGA
jgi:hypothetical protein